MNIKGVVFLLLLAGLTYGGIQYSSRQKKSPFLATQTSYEKNGLSLCILSGDMKDTKTTEKSGLGALGNMVRIRFDVSNIEECKGSAASYCQKQLAQGFIPANLGLIIRGNEANPISARYSVSKECVLKESEEK